jgi:hypothetical protein
MVPKYIQVLFGERADVKGKLKPEDKLAIDITQDLITHTVQGRLTTPWFHVPNELGRNTVIYGIIQKAKGVVSGVADYIFLRANNPIAIEIKAGKGKQSDNQIAFQKWCEISGIKYYLCNNKEDFFAILYNENLIT